MTSSQRQWLHSSVGLSVAPVSEVTSSDSFLMHPSWRSSSMVFCTWHLALGHFQGASPASVSVFLLRLCCPANWYLNPSKLAQLNTCLQLYKFFPQGTLKSAHLLSIAVHRYHTCIQTILYSTKFSSVHSAPQVKLHE